MENEERSTRQGEPWAPNDQDVLAGALFAWRQKIRVRHAGVLTDDQYIDMVERHRMQVVYSRLDGQ